MNEIDSDQLSGRIQSLVDALRQGGDDSLSMSDVAAVTEVLITTMRRYFAAVDTKIYAEFRDLADHISQTRTEIVRLRADKIKSEKIPKAGKELDAIVRSTEEATDTIMEAAEEIMGADTADAEAYQTLVNDACMRIFEACSFQDLTGQRITKVVKTFTYIEDRISTLLEAHGDLLPAAGDEDADETVTVDGGTVLDGPQMEGGGVSQDDVDAMFVDDDDEGEAKKEDDKKTSQDDIDALFD
ncbi:MAG: protein phosphatase CheZ [Alphaproteobacteria bacterium]|nr:chemotaxis protein [Rhodospirillaceae bacterium]MDP6403980.1 protein phosphatase CheZ [Alphaproteobacteria bacterium]MDP6620807.1 protein phosphatase CheZ [Alphaproteobacteria bacterium]